MKSDKTHSAEKNYWNRWYIGVLLFLILQIVIFCFITVEFKK